MKTKKEKEGTPTWLVVIIVIIAVMISFLLFMTEGYKQWISTEIQDAEMRTICTAFLQMIIIAFILGVIFEMHLVRYDKRKQDAVRIN